MSTRVITICDSCGKELTALEHDWVEITIRALANQGTRTVDACSAKCLVAGLRGVLATLDDAAISERRPQ